MSRALLLALLLLPACEPEGLPPEALCDEVAYAVAGRTQACTGDDALAAARFHDFQADTTCAPPSEEALAALNVPLADLYHCPFAIRNLACELVIAPEDGWDTFLSASPTCALLYGEGQ